jgi:hypothetical protein
MDAVVDVRSAAELARLGGLAVLNLEGLQTRYEDPASVLERIASVPEGEVQELLAAAYLEPVREELVARRLAGLRAAGSSVMVAATPGAARRWGPFCAQHGADVFLVQSQVSSARHLASGYDPLELAEFTRSMGIPVAVGNTTSYEAAYQLMGQGVAAVFVGVGPGAACTTREVLGIGVPQVTAIADVAAARDAFFDDTGRYVAVVADGGMRRGGELARHSHPRRHGGHDGTHPVRAGVRDGRLGEPDGRFAPVDGSPRRSGPAPDAASRDGGRTLRRLRGQVLAATGTVGRIREGGAPRLGSVSWRARPLPRRSALH